jgi:hypothetical protein
MTSAESTAQNHQNWVGEENRQANGNENPKTGEEVKTEEQAKPDEPAKTGENRYPEDPRGTAIRIRPNEHYTVFWDINRKRTSGCDVPARWSDTLGFAPGEYAFTIDGKAYVTPGSGEEKDYHTFTQTALLRVSISQISAMWAAMIGAILAYIVTALQQDNDFAKLQTAEAAGKFRVLLVIGRNVVSAALLGAAITIVSSRLADTAFPVKVSINDVWGALTIGFVAYFLGSKFIDKLAKL